MKASVTMIGEGGATETEGNEYAFTVGDFLRTIRKRFWIILLVVIVSVGIAFGFSLLQKPVYETSIKILVGQEQQGETVTSLQGNIEGLQQLTQTMEEAVNSRPVAEAVIDQLGLKITPEDFLKERLSAEQIGTTQFIEVKYRDTKPERAQRVGNAVGDVFSEQVSEVSPSANSITATVWERAALPESPVSPDLLLNTLLALALGTMLGVVMAFLVEYLDDSWTSAEEVEQISGVPTFGVVPQFKVPKSLAPKAKKGSG